MRKEIMDVNTNSAHASMISNLERFRPPCCEQYVVAHIPQESLESQCHPS
jgi:hypothetical protein